MEDFLFTGRELNPKGLSDVNSQDQIELYNCWAFLRVYKIVRLRLIGMITKDSIVLPPSTTFTSYSRKKLRQLILQVVWVKRIPTLQNDFTEARLGGEILDSDVNVFKTY